MKDRAAWILGVIVVLYVLYSFVSGGAKSEVAAACQDYGQVKIDGKLYECKLK